MITSQEINAMISMQQQQAASLGVPVTSPMSGASQYPPQFNYTPRPWGGAQLGQAAAGGLMNSAGMGAGGLSSMAFNLTGAASMAGMGAGFLGFKGAAGALGALGDNAFLGGVSRLNPLNSMMMGGGAAVSSAYSAGGLAGVFSGVGMRGIAQGALGTAGLLNPISLAAMAASVPLQMMHHGAQQYSQTASMLGSYNQFANPFASGGRGFSEGQMSSIVSGMRGIQEASPFISMKDMQQTMTRFNEMGMNQGERDAEEFSRKFKAMAKTVTAMSKALGTTIDEASKVFGQMRGAGFYTGADVMGNTLLAGTMRGQGISGSTMLGAQMAGGGMSRAAQLGTTPGAKSVGGVMSMLTGARGTGALSNEEMMNITGAATPDQAIAQLSTTMAGSLTNFYTQSGVGQSMLAALGATNAKGEFTGGLDEDALEGLRSGKIDINNLVSKGRGKVSSRNAALSFKTKGQDVAGALISEGDPTAAIGAIMQSVAGDKFKDMDPENLITLLTERIQGLGRKEAEAMTKLYREGEKVRRESKQQIRQEVQAEIFATDLRENHSLSGLGRRFMGGLSDTVVAPLARAGQAVSVGAGEVGQGISDTLFGVTRVGSSESLQRQSLIDIARGGGAAVGGSGAQVGFSNSAFNERVRKGLVSKDEFTRAAAVSGDMQVTSGMLTDEEWGKAMDARKSARSEEVLRQRIEMGLGGSLSPGDVGAAIRKGQTAEEYIRGLSVDSNGSGGRTVGDVMSSGSAAEAEQLRHTIARIATEQGSTAAVKATANIGTYGSAKEALEVNQKKITDIMAYGGSMFHTDQSDYERLMGSGAINVVTAAKGKYSAKDIKSTIDAALASGDVTKYLTEQGYDTSVMSEKDLKAFASWAEDTDHAGLTKEQMGTIATAAGGVQKIADYSDLASAANAARSSAVGSFYEEDVAGASQLGMLATMAGSGQVGATQDAIEALFGELEGKGITAGTLDSDRYGVMGDPLKHGLSQRKAIGSLQTVEERQKYIERAFNISVQEQQAAGIDLSTSESAKEVVGRLNVQGDFISGGGAFTDSTQKEAAKFYAETFSKVNTEILRIQENNNKTDSKVDALVAKNG